MERMSKPKFIKEIEKFEGKERAKCGRWYIRVYGELDHKPMVELESLEIVVKELHKLEEENKNLKEKVEKMEYGNSLVFDDVERICNEKLQLEEENKKLKEEVRFLEECLDRKEKLNEKYRKEIEELKETLEHRDSVLSIMYDLLRSDLSDYEQLCMIDVVIDVEVGNEPQNKLREELLDRFWKRDF